jgi:hypothetical protein
MTIDLSKGELRTLLHMVSLALYVSEANQDDECQPEIEAMQEVADKLYEAGIIDGNRDIAEYDPTAGQFMLREGYVEDSLYSRTIQEFEEEFFWTELSSALAERDLRAKGEPNPLNYDKRLQDLEDHYMDIFSDHGVDRLHMILPGPHQ